MFENHITDYLAPVNIQTKPTRTPSLRIQIAQVADILAPDKHAQHALSTIFTHTYRSSDIGPPNFTNFCGELIFDYQKVALREYYPVALVTRS